MHPKNDLRKQILEHPNNKKSFIDVMYLNLTELKRYLKTLQK
jgi:hypothetical protein